MNSWGETVWENYGKQAKSKCERRVSNWWIHVRKRGVTLNVYIYVQGGGGGVEKSVIRYVRTNGWRQKYVSEHFLCIGLAKYTRALPPARKMLLFPSVIITIIYPMRELEFRNFRYLLAGLSTEALAELYWVITLGVFEKINSIYFQGISLVFSRIRRPSQN